MPPFIYALLAHGMLGAIDIVLNRELIARLPKPSPYFLAPAMLFCSSRPAHPSQLRLMRRNSMLDDYHGSDGARVGMCF